MYTYTLNGVPVTPVPDTWEIEHFRNKGQIFFRRKLSGDIIFKDDDYDYLLTLTECTELTFIIYCDGVAWWTGIFKYPYDFHFDTDACYASGTPQVLDEYSCIMDKYEMEVSFFGGLPGKIDIELRTCAGVLLNDYGLTNSLRQYLDSLVNDLNHLECNLDLVSSFFWRDEFPGYAAGHYAATFGTNNYVTGAANRLEYIYLRENATISGLCDSTGDLWTFREFEGLLRDRFNAYWFIDSDGKFRIEHISYFLPGFLYSDYTAGIDLTTILEKGRSYAYRRNKYEYRTEELFDIEIWKWQHYDGTEGTVAHGHDFEGEPIYYGVDEWSKYECVPGEFKKKEISTPYFWSDIYWAYQLIGAGTLDAISCPKGFCIWDVDIATNYIRCETGCLTAVNIINGHCSTANLMEHYFTWDRIFLTGTMNGTDVTPVNTFLSAIKKKLQDKITFPMCCNTDFDAMDYVTTEMGDGAVYSAVQKPRSMEIQLLYD